ncbi:hypothetical protein ACS72_15780 [Acinetobacter sp. VT 511]|nr:hypothetical protein ACS72_15780 [Acinetobacter sp. VT 511]
MVQGGGHQGRPLGFGPGGGVGQDDDGRLQPLGAVDGHDPHLVAGALHLALHLDIGLFQQSETGLQIAAAALLGRQHLGQAFVYGFFRLAAQPVQDARPARPAVGADAVQT